MVFLFFFSGVLQAFAKFMPPRNAPQNPQELLRVHHHDSVGTPESLWSLWVRERRRNGPRIIGLNGYIKVYLGVS